MIGISTYCLIGEPLESALDRIVALTDRVEIMDEGLHFLKDPFVLENYSAHFSLHAPFHGTNIESVFEPIRKASVGVTIECFAVASEAGAPVVIHPGYFAWESERERAGRQFKKSLDELSAAAREYSVEFSFENMGDMHFFNLQTPADLAIAPGVPFTLDVGHAHINKCLAGFLKTPFSHMHLHDNDGRRDSHGPVGSGTIDFSPVIAAMKERNATAVIEVGTFGGAQESLRILEKL